MAKNYFLGCYFQFKCDFLVNKHTHTHSGMKKMYVLLCCTSRSTFKWFVNLFMWLVESCCVKKRLNRKFNLKCQLKSGYKTLKKSHSPCSITHTHIQHTISKICLVFCRKMQSWNHLINSDSKELSLNVGPRGRRKVAYASLCSTSWNQTTTLKIENWKLKCQGMSMWIH